MFGLFNKKSQTEIFEYTDIAGASRRADPLKVRILLTEATHGHFDDLMTTLLTPSEDEQGNRVGNYEEVVFLSMGAMKKLLVATAYAFGLKQFDENTGEGATDQYLSDLLLSFDDWLQKKSETPSSTPT